MWLCVAPVHTTMCVDANVNGVAVQYTTTVSSKTIQISSPKTIMVEIDSTVCIYYNNCCLLDSFFCQSILLQNWGSFTQYAQREALNVIWIPYDLTHAFQNIEHMVLTFNRISGIWWKRATENKLYTMIYTNIQQHSI